MHRKFITIVTVAALSLAGMSTTPAYAGDKETARWIAGIAAAAIIGAAIADNNKKKKKRRHSQQTHRTHNDYGQTHNQGYDYRHGSGYEQQGHARPLPHSVQRKLLPNRCLVRGETRRGTVRGFGRHCLNRHYSYTNSLPQQCAVRALNRRGEFRRIIYRKKCLNRHGYQVARR